MHHPKFTRNLILHRPNDDVLPRRANPATYAGDNRHVTAIACTALQPVVDFGFEEANLSPAEGSLPGTFNGTPGGLLCPSCQASPSWVQIAG